MGSRRLKEVAVMQQKAEWSWLPASIRAQAIARYKKGKREVGLSDGFVYHWVQEAPPVGYRGPLPFGRLLRRSRA
jgi:hypothetical protein